MSPDELVYLAILAASIPVGFLFRYLSPSAKQWSALLLGLSVTIATCQIHTLHSLVTVLGTWMIIKYDWRAAPSLSLGWTFLYLLFFRLSYLFGLPSPTPFANAIQLLLTLKMVSLANEVQQYHLAKKEDVTSFSKSPLICGLTQEPSLYDTVSYSYCYIGLFTGPFFRYQTYVDWLQQPCPRELPGRVPCLQRLRFVPLYAVFFLIVNHYFPLAYVRTEEYLDHHFLFRLFYMTAVFFVFRMRFYAAWCGAEAGCISSGLGCYPEGAQSKPGGGPSVQYSSDPASATYDFRTIQNIDCYNTDFCVKVRHGMKYWNMTVQWWLHQYIYAKAPFKAYTLKAAWTMFISAYWHGIHAGYYLSFLTIPLCMGAESALESTVRAKLGPQGQNIFDWIHWFLKMRAYDYMCMGFVLLSFSDTINYWSSIFFCIHVIAVMCMGLGMLLKGGKQERKLERECRNDEDGKRETRTEG
ncbi:lysophospholipid acyltransferase 7 [Paramormyrops kingsleyae]|uniref:Leukocyte receptor cluster member 4 n=1 Tax=Paramormyrops kingsleyae TaxID=1676925 RepID=A0A3B3SL85_9TELE|nr:lysophospholipid acyltransferase 7 [Paramormyrops kingsleyae]